MHLQKLTLLTITMAVAAFGAPQNQQIPAAQQQQQPAASAPVAQNREAPVYPETSYAGGFSSGGNAGAQYAAPAASYGAPQAAYGAPAQQPGQQQQQQQGSYAQPSGNTGYYYYYYPVQESKADYHPQKEAYTATDSYGIDPLGIIAVLAVAGLVIAGLALLFPGWAYVKSDEHVYYRSNDGTPSVLGLSKEDYKTLTSLVLAAIEGEDCSIEKMMCDAGKLVKKVKKADTFLRIMEDFAPSSVSTSIKKLRTAMKNPEECKNNVTCGKKKVAPVASAKSASAKSASAKSA